MSLKRKLNRYKHHLGNMGKKDDHAAGASPNTSFNLSFEKEWTSLGVRPYIFEECCCLIREVVYPLTHVHGHYSFAELHDTVSEWNKNGVSHSLSSKGYLPSQLFSLTRKRQGSEEEPAIRYFCSAMQGFMMTRWSSSSISCQNRETKRLFITVF